MTLIDKKMHRKIEQGNFRCKFRQAWSTYIMWTKEWTLWTNKKYLQQSSYPTHFG